MGASKRKGGSRLRASPRSADRPWERLPLPLLLGLWSFAVHAAFLLGSPLKRTPVSFLFFGDSLHFLAQARAVAEGATFNEGLPFHPPLAAWLVAPLWRVSSSPEAVSFAAKLLMAALSGAALALLFQLVRDRVENAFWILALVPLAFPEIVLTQAVNSELPYRALILLTLVNGWRRPLLAGALQGVAALARAEHLPLVLLLALLLWWWPDRWRDAVPQPARRRRFVSWALVGLAVVLVPYSILTASRLADYNARNAQALEQPLPTLVPVSFYGPLNFALAHREEGILFSRRTLPPAPSGASQLDPTFPPHQRVIVDGYRLGLAAIAEQPGRFVSRSVRKLLLSLSALGAGVTGLDLPFGGEWSRRPVDLAQAPGAGTAVLAVVVGLLACLGAWRLRAWRALLVIGGGLLLFRLAINVAFFPYLRSVMIVAPFWWLLAWSGLASLLGRRARAVLIAACLLLGAIHFSSALAERAYRLDGERDASGAVIEDRTVTVRLESAGRADVGE